LRYERSDARRRRLVALAKRNAAHSPPPSTRPTRVSELNLRHLAIALLPIYGGLVVLNATVATAVAAGLALVGAAWTLGQSDATARRTRTVEYRARWDQPAFFEARQTASDFLNVSGSEDQRWLEWRSWVKRGRKTSERLHIMAVLNFWEEVASAYNQNLLDNEWFQSDLAWQLTHNWNRSKWFVNKFRTEEKNVAFFSEWQVSVKAVTPALKAQEADGKRRAEEALRQGRDLLTVEQPGVG
jgi:hypothetical protein